MQKKSLDFIACFVKFFIKIVQNNKIKLVWNAGGFLGINVGTNHIGTERLICKNFFPARVILLS